MSIGKITVTYKGLPKVSRAWVKRIKTDTWTRVGLKWYGTMMRGHFTAAGARKYHYGHRKTKEVTTGKVRRSKLTRQPRAPDGRPLVWSGTTMARAKSKRIAATSQSVRVVMPIQALNFIPKGNAKLRMRDEFTKVTESEQNTLRKDAVAYMTKRFAQLGTKVTASFKGGN